MNEEQQWDLCSLCQRRSSVPPSGRWDFCLDSPVTPAGRPGWTAAALSRTGSCWTRLRQSGLRRSSPAEFVFCSMRPQASEETVGQKVVKTIDPQRDNRPGLVKLTSEFYLGGEVKSCNINWSLRVALCALDINLEQTKYQSQSPVDSQTLNQRQSEVTWT